MKQTIFFVLILILFLLIKKQNKENFLNKNIDILVVGAGGNGQSYFMNFLKNNKININNCVDKDKLKHMHTPEILKSKNIKIKKCIFLYNDPLKSVLSHFRRNWAYIQLNKLGNIHNLKKEDLNDLKTFVDLTEKYNTDIYGIKNQFDNWNNKNLPFPVLLLNFNDILDNKDKLNKFVGKELDYSSFKVKKRKSKKLNENINDKFMLIYMII